MPRIGLDRPNYRLDIQGLRGVAVILVVLYHAGLNFGGGFLGVDVFFVISGFVISDMIMRELKTTGSFSPSQFLLRRIKRLFPALASMLAFVIVYVTFWEKIPLDKTRTLHSAIAAFFSVSNWKFATDGFGYFEPSNVLNPLLHTWSLGIEEQFYLIVPAFVTLAFFAHKKFHLKVTTIQKILILVAIISLAIQIRFSLYLDQNMQNLSSANRIIRYLGDPFYGTPGRVWEFLAGVMACQFIHIRPKLISKYQSLVQNLGVAVIITIAIAAHSQTPRWSIPNIAVTITTMGILLFGLRTDPARTLLQPLTNRYLVWIGDRSYGWYLWHWPMIVFVTKAWPNHDYMPIVAVFASLLMAAASFRFIEMPWRKRLIKRPKLVLTLIAGSLSVLLISAPIMTNIGLTTTSIDSGGLATPAWDIPFHDCFILEDNCLIHAKPSDTDILLVGDSHAASLAQVFVKAATDVGLTPQISTAKGCALIRSDSIFYLYNFKESNKMTDTFCVDFYDFDLKWIQNHRPKAVVISQYASFYINSPRLNEHFESRVSCFAESGRCKNLPRSADRANFFKSLLSETISKITAAGTAVVLVAPLPIQFRNLEEMTSVNQDIGTSRVSIDDQRSDVLNLYRELTAKNSSVILWDPIDQLCGEIICPNSSDSVSFYADNGHQSIAGANRLLDSLKELLQSIKAK